MAATVTPVGLGVGSVSMDGGISSIAGYIAPSLWVKLARRSGPLWQRAIGYGSRSAPLCLSQSPGLGGGAEHRYASPALRFGHGGRGIEVLGFESLSEATFS